ncbi:MAG: putative RND superfamily exporter protein [Thermoproteota archaeon]|jgi:predicted RND superfamily exporter protein
MKKFLIEKRTLLFFSSLIIAALAVPLLFSIKADFSYKAWFKKGDAFVKKYELFEREYGNEDFLSVAILNENGLINTENLNFIEQATEKLYQVHRVLHIDSLTNFKMIKGEEEEIGIDIMMPDKPLSTLNEVELKVIQNNITNTPLINNYLINKKQTFSVLYLRMIPVFEGKHDYNISYKEAKDILDTIKLPKGTTFHLSGSVAVIQEISKEVKADVSMISPTLLILILLMTFLIFKSKVITIIPLINIVTTLLISFAVAGFFGVSFNPITSMVPHILMAICVADCIHIISSFNSFYREFEGKYSSESEQKEQAIKMAIHKKFNPTLFTSLTTAFGFFSLTFTDIKPIYELGIIACIGTLLAWALSFCIVPYLLGVSTPVKRKDSSFSSKKLFSMKYIRVLNKYAYLIIISSAVLSFLGYSVAKKLQVNSSTLRMLDKSNPVRVSSELVKKEFGGFSGIDILITSKDGDLTKLLKDTQKLQNWVRVQPWASKTISIVDYIKELNKAVEGGKEIFYKIPEDQKKSSSLLFLYEMSAGSDQETKWISTDKKKTRLNALWITSGSNEASQIIRTIENKAKELDVSIEVSGKTYLLKGINNYLVEVFVRSILVAIMLVFIFMLINLKSIPLTIISLVPNVIPIFFGLGAMHIFNIEIDFAAVMVASVCIGIVIDDTIHFFHGYRFAPQKDMESKLLYVLNSTGQALINTSLVLIVSFFTFLLGNVSLNINFGILTIVIIFVALICDLVILPAILLKAKNIIKA